MKKSVLILLTAMLLGSCYGWVSGECNQNPYYAVGGQLLVSKSQCALAWGWRPSPFWLPSYALCKAPVNGFGISHTRSGYLFRSEAHRALYLAGSTVLGGTLGCLAACVALAAKRRDKAARRMTIVEEP